MKWKKSWVEKREISKRQDRNNWDFWMYDEDVNNIIKEFAKI